jgi:hypothetical protein
MHTSRPFLSMALSLSHAPRPFLFPQVVFKVKSLALPSHFAANICFFLVLQIVVFSKPTNGFDDEFVSSCRSIISRGFQLA